MDTYSWIARNCKSGSPVDGATIVLMSMLLNKNITIVSFGDPAIYRVDNDQLDQIVLGYFGQQEFVPADVGKLTF